MHKPLSQFVTSTLAENEGLHPLFARTIAEVLLCVPAGSKVGLYGCGNIAQALITLQESCLQRFDVCFIRTDPGGQDGFQGYPVLAVAALGGNPFDWILLLDRPARTPSS